MLKDQGGRGTGTHDNVIFIIIEPICQYFTPSQLTIIFSLKSAKSINGKTSKRGQAIRVPSVSRMQFPFAN